VQQRSLAGLMVLGMDTSSQLLLGSAFGLLAALAGWAIIERPFMRPIKARYTNLIAPWIGSRTDRVLVSFAAGIGEEIFFRGAVQHWLGIPITAVLFVAIHGYLDPRDFRISAYGAFMVLVMLAVGWMAMHWGLVAPMAAHTVIDIVLLERLAREVDRQGQRA
jgi:hypothetical protein